MTKARRKPDSRRLDSVILTVIANRLDGIVREMTNTLLRAARSAVISSARDFSCCIITGDNQLLASAEGLPVHIFGAHLQGENMCKYHAGDIREGDAYLDNDPYGGNTHPADHTILVPVFVDGEHLFTTVAKCHMADIGNSIPSSYFAKALDVYEEGALVFPAVRLQRNFKNEPDIIRMCRARIRVPEQWYGDTLAALGSARIAERRLKQLCEKYGKKTIKVFIKDWFDYSELRMITSIRKLPKARIENVGRSDPLEGILPDGLTIKVGIDIDPKKAMIAVDLRDNPPCVDCGLNTSRAAATQFGGRCHLQQSRQGYPAQCRLVPAPLVPVCREQRCGRAGVPAQLLDRDHQCLRTPRQHHPVRVRQVGRRSWLGGRGNRPRRRHGRALGQGPPAAECALRQPYDALDQRRSGKSSRGWLGELCDSRHRRSDVSRQRRNRRAQASVPSRVVVPCSGFGRGRALPRRPGAGGDVYGARESSPGGDPVRRPVCAAGGVNGGHNGTPGSTHLINHNGDVRKLPNVVNIHVQKGQCIRGRDSSGGGYGNPLTRDPGRVLIDVLEGWESREKARDVYGVVFTGEIEDDSLAVNIAATKARRAELAQQSAAQADGPRSGLAAE
jgi:N-methylhydantoinase B